MKWARHIVLGNHAMHTKLLLENFKGIMKDTKDQLENSKRKQCGTARQRWEKGIQIHLIEKYNVEL
jgi:hypothetical protein